MNRKVLIPLVLVAALGGWWFYQHQQTPPADVLYGNVDIREATLSFRVAGRVSKVLVDEGSAIKPGQLLAELDHAPLVQQLAAAKADMENLAARADMMHAGSRKEDIDSARSKVAAAEAALTQASADLARQKTMQPVGAASEKTLQAAQAQADSAQANLAGARANLAALTTGYRKEEIRQADAQLAAAKARLESARISLDDAKLVAPSAGIILTRSIEAGTQVAPGTPAFGLSLTEPVWVRAYVSEPVMGRFANGTRVLLSTDTRAGKPYHGTVGFVSPQAEFTPKSVETADLRTSLVYRIRIVVSDADSQLRQGMPVTIRLDQ